MLVSDMPIPQEHWPFSDGWPSAAREASRSSYSESAYRSTVALDKKVTNAEQRRYWTENIAEFEQLRYLSLRGALGQPLLTEVSKLDGLLHLELEGRVKFDDLGWLSKLNQLEHLCLTLNQETDFASISNLEGLSSLALVPGSNVTALNGFTPAKMVNLETLILSSSSESKPLKIDSVSFVTQFEQLRYLGLYNLSCIDNRLSFLLGMPNLQGVMLAPGRSWNKEDVKLIEDSRIKIKWI